MKKYHIITAIVSFCLIISLIAGSIDYNFLGVVAETEESVNNPDESTSDGRVVDEPASDGDMVEGEPVPDESVSDNSVPDVVPPAESENPEEPVDVVYSLSAESDELSVIYSYDPGFAPGSEAVLEKLGDDEAKKLADDLSKTLDGQNAIPVVGFTLDIRSGDTSMTDTVNVELTGSVDPDAKLYKYHDGEFILAGYTKTESGAVAFQSSVPETYLFVDITYDEEPFRFTYSDENVVVSAVCMPKSGIPAEAELHAEKLEENSDAYKEAYDALLATMELADNETLVFAPYDVYFTHNGKRIEPVEGMVQVSMEFSDKVLEANSEEEVLGDVFCVHIKDDGKVEELDAAVSESTISFEVDSFSVMAAAAVSRAAVTSTIYGRLYEDGTFTNKDNNNNDSGHGTLTQSFSLNSDRR